ncbi:MAG: GNAT family N-acetyltransferase, partial [Candidatus Thorarchaeota archaeon]
RVGLLTFKVDDRQLEIVTLDSLMEGVGIGTALVDHTIADAKKKKCNRVWLVTTNDNTDALRFYQRRGFVLQKINRGAIEESRRLKPSIPHVGNHGIPIRDEIVMEYML